MLRRVQTWLLAALLGGGAACATPQTEALLGAPPAGARRVELHGIPLHPQTEGFCGPAALAAVLAAAGEPVSPKALAAEVFSPDRRGTLSPSLDAAARRHRRVPYPVEDLEGIVAELRAGHPVLVLQNLGLRWLPVWHYAVVVGFDLDRRVVWLHSGKEGRVVEGLGLFERTWRRGGSWARVVLDPDAAPLAVRETEALRAIAVFERIGAPDVAARAYGAALGRWPRSLAAWIGLGNSRHALGDRQGAAAAFRRAAEIHPDSPEALNNLAHVLAELGRREEALAAARKAVALSGPERAIFRRTLEEIGAPTAGGPAGARAP